MDLLTSNPIASLAAVTTAAAYLDAKFCFSRDLREIRQGRDFGRRLGQRIQQLGDVCSMYGIFDKYRGKDGDDAIWFEGRTISYGELKRDVDRLAGLLHARGVAAGDFVAVFTSNSPEMAIVILAISKLGAVAALINTNLRHTTLAHSLNICTPVLIISTPDLAAHIDSNVPHLTLNLSSFDGTATTTTSTITPIGPGDLKAASFTSLPPAKRTLSDGALLIYTSGTTGLPKACFIKNMQLCLTSTPVPADHDNRAKYFPLRTYSPLPLFHGTAIFGGLTYSVGNGGTLCLARKFSASNYFKDATLSRANCVLYIGELCRYLLASSPSPYDRAHAITRAYGNGLRGDIWDPFKTRFGINEIREFYRSTEGLAKFDNFGDGAWGAGKLGFAGPLRRWFENMTFIVKFDTDTQLPIRDPKTGFCVKIRPGEEGEVIGRVVNRATMSNYLRDDGATEKKLIRDVFEKGDLFQRMGDLVVLERDGWVRFHDRIGDTFRWKGENVSAGEVRDHISAIQGVLDAIVFGIKLASYDGQAGAACIVLKSQDPSARESFIRSLHSNLVFKGVPSYAIPRLVRITDSPLLA
ncbi:hypothetical protein AJ80_00211 [Polytolypa hystricis UAMH7299]|uniref:AMP-dependent synthetase/ligase domain-containing protein n=1 Tax=Polytolypa hystricis (strain UAMH7299) TaxID=1447883 RepID=A0A2B7Z538_POLH7|nr:hypothetical protein AJ80_00211 [Polytolypa hystricis UAMH7299]